MNAFLDVLKYTIPSLIVFATAYFILKSFIESEEKKRTLEIRTKNQKLITPIRLQAYERLTLFLERISPNSLILRVQKPNMTASQLQREILAIIRTEFEHNLSQQIYISKQAWEVSKSAKENLVKLINASADKVNPKADAMELSKVILQTIITVGASPTQAAIDFLKTEVNQFF